MDDHDRIVFNFSQSFLSLNNKRATISCVAHFYYSKKRIVAIEITPTITVVDKLLVQIAMIKVGINAVNTGQSSVTYE